MTLVIPTVTWQDAREEWVVDTYSRLLQDRIIFLGTLIDEQIANLIPASVRAGPRVGGEHVLAVDASRLP
jgi:ATP-dependent Clp protease protease subunit